MSSNYHVLCIAHDPAIVIDGGWTTPLAAVAAVQHRIGEPLRAHTNCDLLIGRYSYPLVEVCCPGLSHASLTHVGEEWVDVGWLRLLHAAYRSKDVAMVMAAQGVSECWSAVRVGRLRNELGIDPAHHLAEETTP